MFYNNFCIRVRPLKRSDPEREQTTTNFDFGDFKLQGDTFNAKPPVPAKTRFHGGPSLDQSLHCWGSRPRRQYPPPYQGLLLSLQPSPDALGEAKNRTETVSNNTESIFAYLFDLYHPALDAGSIVIKRGSRIIFT
jgi:hypothetical protein